MIFDTHAHYDDDAFEEDRDVLLTGLKDKNVGIVVNVAADHDSIADCIALAEKYDFMYAAVGIHPEHTESLNEEIFKYIRQSSLHDRVVAIGETGLDYHYDTDRKLQKYWFVKHMELALERGLPLIIHSRDAAEDTLEQVRKYYDCDNPGVVHCYSYSPEIAEEYVKRGFFIGVGGVVTFKNAKKLLATVERIPIEHILLETDCPYLAPEPFRGKRNNSEYLSFVAEKIAALKGITTEEVIRITADNAMRMYGIDSPAGKMLVRD